MAMGMQHQADLKRKSFRYPVSFISCWQGIKECALAGPGLQRLSYGQSRVSHRLFELNEQVGCLCFNALSRLRKIPGGLVNEVDLQPQSVGRCQIYMKAASWRCHSLSYH